MTFSPEMLCTCRSAVDETFSADLCLAGAGLWAGVISSGSCTVGAVPAGAGDFFLGTGPLVLRGAGICHVGAVLLGGTVAERLDLPSPRLAAGRTCPRCGEVLALLLAGGQTPGRTSALAYALLCDLWEAGDGVGAMPALVVEAVALMREDYATLYGVAELAEQLCVSKCHLIRLFSSAMGVPPGQYLTSVRLEAAKELLLLREYTLEIIAGFCGFSGANYFCRVFRRVEGVTPTAWLEMQSPAF